MPSNVITNFTAGELSPKLYGRTDLSKYFNGCKTLENMMVWPHGGAFRRPGTRYIAETKDSSKECRIIKFAFSVTQEYIIEIGDAYMRFYMDDGQIVHTTSTTSAWVTATAYAVADFVKDSDVIYRCIKAHTSGDTDDEPGTGATWETYWVASAIYEIASPYAESEISELKFTQSADTMYIVHPDYEPRKLTRTAHTAWTITTMGVEDGPFLSINTTDTTITPSAVTGTGITLTASAAIFDADHVGALWKIKHNKGESTISGSFTATGNSTSGECGGDWQFVTHGTWTGTVVIQRSFDGGSTWYDYQTYTGADDRNINVTGTETRDDVTYRVSCSAYTSGTISYEFHIREYEVEGIAKITAVATGGLSATATVLTDFGATTASDDWYEGAWSDYRGWPHCVTFHEERLWFGATDHQPQTIWGSASGDYESFDTGTNDADALSYTLVASGEINIIRWMVSKTYLVIGTVGGEWLLKSTSSAPITPTNVSLKRETTYGSYDMDVTVASSNVIYVQRKAKQIIQLGYNIDYESYIGVDLTLLSEHITGDGVVRSAYQKEPLPVLWYVRDDGDLVGCTYIPIQEVVAWHKHSTTGTFEDVACISDEVWFVVNRTINGSTVRYIEYMEPWDETLENSVFMDCAAQYDGAEKTITGVTKANPGVVTSAAHGLSNGDVVRITGVVGMTEINNRRFEISGVTTNTFQLYNTDTSDYTAYSSGGIAKKCASTVSGLSYLEGETVDLIVDGATHAQETVASGAISLDSGRYGSVIWVGLPYTPIIQTMNIETETSEGTAQGYIKRVTRAVVRLYKTLSMKMSHDGTAFEIPVFRTSDDETGNPPELYTGDKHILMPHGNDREAYVYITQEYPLPLTVTAIIPEVEVGKR